MNWRGRPLTSHDVVINSIAATTTRTGLTVQARLDDGAYPTGSRSATRRWPPCRSAATPSTATGTTRSTPPGAPQRRPPAQQRPAEHRGNAASSPCGVRSHRDRPELPERGRSQGRCCSTTPRTARRTSGRSIGMRSAHPSRTPLHEHQVGTVLVLAARQDGLRDAVRRRLIRHSPRNPRPRRRRVHRDHQRLPAIRQRTTHHPAVGHCPARHPARRRLSLARASGSCAPFCVAQVKLKMVNRRDGVIRRRR
jgi:hypothetical protein